MPRHLAIGDIHGHLDALLRLVDAVQLRPDDVIITLGDYVDRGPDTRGVIDWLIATDQSHTLVPLRGNHDQMMLEARDDSQALSTWLGYGGQSSLDSYASTPGAEGSLSDVPERHWDFLENRLVPIYETDEYFFVHGNVYPDVPLADQSDRVMYWGTFDDPPPHQSGKVMVCGHTSQRSGLPAANANAICIDTRIYDGGWLTCFHAESGDMWQANALGDVRTLHLDDLA